MKKSLVIVGVVLVVAAVWFYRTARRSAQPRPASPAAAKSSGAAASTPEPTVATTTDQKLLQNLITAFTKPDASAQRLEQALHTATSAQDRYRLLGQVRDHHIARADALRLLREYLKDPDTKVRVYAATLLYEFGSAEGRTVLLDAMKAALDPSSPGLTDAVNAAATLNRYREVIPSDLLANLYERRGHPGLLSIMAMQGDPRYAPFLMEAAKAKPIAGNIQDLGLARVSQAADYVGQIYATTADPRSKAAAAWSMFRINGDRAALGYVLDVANGAIKGQPTEEQAIDAGEDAIRDLAATADPAARDFLRQNVATTRADVNSRALASLYYVQKDYAFVDDYLRQFLTAPSGTNQHVDTNMVWTLLFARNQPDLMAIARAQKPEAFAYYAPQLEGKPPESWVWGYLSGVPLR